MSKMKVWFAVVIAVCLIILLLSILQVGSSNITWEGEVNEVLWADWTAYVKLIAPLIAGIILLWQGFAGNILTPVKPTTKVIGFGILSIGIGFSFETYMRIILNNDPGALNFGTPFFVFGAALVAWALFDFPARLEARLKDSQRPWFFGSVAVAFVTTAIVMILPSDKSPSFFDIVSQALYAILTLAIFAGALRCTMVFAEGRIGRPFRLISIGGLSIFAYVYYIWLPFTPNVNAFHPIHILWIFCFLITILGAADLTLTEE
jgi:hypothetical protein